MEIFIDGILYNTSDFTIEEIAEKSGKTVKEIEKIILEQCQAEAIQTVNEYAKIYQERLAPSNLVEEYRRKEKAANAYVNNSASNADKDILKAEADTLGISIEDHVQAILLKVALYDHAWPQIVKFRTETKEAIKQAKTPEAIGAILLAAKQQADAAFASLGE